MEQSTTDVSNDNRQSSFSRAVKHIKKKTLKKAKWIANLKSRNFISVQEKGKEGEVKPHSSAGGKRGVLYLSHIPEGFLEDGMKDYFSQFGQVHRVKLCRSEKTGRSKGFAFIEFQHSEIAQIAAETMNNYIFFNRLLKAHVIPYVRDTKIWDQQFNSKDYPGRCRQLQYVKGINRNLSEDQGRKRLSRRLKNLKLMAEKLKRQGINYSYQPQVEEFENSENILLACNESKKLKKLKKLKTKVKRKADKDLSFSDSTKHVLEVDESDQEIEFKTPPNVIKKKLKVNTNRSSARNLKVQCNDKTKSKRVKQVNDSALSSRKKSLKPKTSIKKLSEAKPLKKVKLQTKKSQAVGKTDCKKGHKIK